MKKLLAFTLVLALILSFATPIMAAPPLGAFSKTVNIPPRGDEYSEYFQGPMLATDGWQDGGAITQTSRGLGVNYSWDEATMNSYVFDPTIFPDIQWHPDGFPLSASLKPPVQHLGEMRYLAEKYPEITKLHYIGRTRGINPDQTGANAYVANSDYAVPIYALEICSAPGVWDGRPATLHQSTNHGMEVGASEMNSMLMWYLVTNYGKIDEITNLINTTRIYILPYTNGDGSILHYRGAAGTSPNGRRGTAYGVDSNRNWAYRWGSDDGSSSRQGDSNYRGTAPNSEPETTAISSIYKNDQIISSISGHQSGEIIIFAWAHIRNTQNGHPLIYEIAKQQTDINGYTAQNGNVMYPQSGEINDYLWGAMRALGFTFEFTGNSFSAGNNPNLIMNIPSPTGLPSWRINAAAYQNRPTTDLTAPLAFFEQEEFYAGYQNYMATAGPDFDFVEEQLGVGNGIEGINTLPLPGNRMPTAAMLEAELAKRPGFVKDKIFMSHVAANNTEASAIVNILNREGAKGWIVVNTSDTVDYRYGNGNYGLASVGAQYNPDGSTLPVTAMTKGYAGNLHKEHLKNPTITVTFPVANADTTSLFALWERQKPAFMKNMSFATTYANQLKGTIKDENGANIDATLEASLIIEGKIMALESTGNYGIERPYEEQWREVQKTRYDVNAQTAPEGSFTWYMLPSKQTEYTDKGWTVTASAPGRYTEIKNITFPSDGVDPGYQRVISGINFVLPKAIDVTYTLGAEKVALTTFAKDGTAADKLGVYVKADGKSVEVVALGDGKYEAVVPVDAKYVAVGFPGSAPVEFGTVEKEDIPLSQAISEIAYMELTSKASVITAGDYITLNTEFVKKIDTNVVRLTYNYDPDLFEYSGNNFDSEKSLYTVLNEVVGDGQVEVTLMKKDNSYGFKEFYPYTTEWVVVPKYITPGGIRGGEYDKVIRDYDMMFRAKADVKTGVQTITVVADYVERIGDEKVEKTSHMAMLNLTTLAEDEIVFNLITLSNLIDAFGAITTDPAWYTELYKYDFNGNSTIDISDIVYIALRIK